MLFIRTDKDHIWRSLEIPDIPHPIYTAITVLQANKFLIYFTATAWTDFFANSNTRYSFLPRKPYTYLLHQGREKATLYQLLCQNYNIFPEKNQAIICSILPYPQVSNRPVP